MKSGRKYLYVMPDFSGGGPERVSAELLKSLPGLGINTDLLLFRDVRNCDCGDSAGTRIITLLGSEERISRHLPRFVRRFMSVAAGYDVIVAIGEADPWPLHFVTLAGLLMRKRVVWAVHTSLSRFCRLNDMPAHKIALTRLTGRLAHRIIAVSHGVKEDLAAGMGIPESKIEVIYNPNDIASIQALAGEPIDPGDEPFFERPVILYVGHISTLKGCDLLISAARRLLDRGIDFNVVLMGEGPEENKFRSMAGELGVEGRVFMPGFRSNPYRYMARAEVFALPSRLEALPTVLIEAMACGCPVVATDCLSGPAEVLGGGRYGLLTPEDDAESLAGAIESLLSDRQRRDELVRLGLGRAWDFETSRAAARYAEVLGAV